MAGEMDRPTNLSPVRVALMIKQLRSRIEGVEWLGREPIAIVGAACRFPGEADGLDGFLHLLSEGRDAVSLIPEARWDLGAYYDADPDAPGKMYSRHAALLADPYRFDAEFFGIAPREAQRMDPQQRLLLETAWSALEDAAILPSSLAGSSSGVFVGACANDHTVTEFQDPTSIEAYSSSGAAHSIIANRFSYLLDLRGPSLTVDTACSSSLVAVHLACQSLRSGEVDLAIAAGVNVVLEPEGNIALSKARMMAADGRCKTFDARADGYVRGEGCGVVVLKRLADALRDRDIIHAVIRGSAVNQDGRSNGLTAPNLLAQVALIRGALGNAGLDADQVAYIEAHGTGTVLGDPIEVDALREVYGRGSLPCALGSVKTNFGHLEGAAGIAGLLKAVLSVEHARIFPHLHFQRLNPSLALDGCRFFVPLEAAQWPAGSRRCAAVSSFGFGGTNAHVIVEQAPAVEAAAPASADRSASLLLLSARNPRTLSALAQRYAKYLAEHPESSLADVCFTSNTTRTAFPTRLAIVASSEREARAALERASAAQPEHSPPSGCDALKVGFLCTGQGSQYVRMGRELYEAEGVFRRELERCLGELGDGGALWRVMNGEGGEEELERTEHAQPALFAIGYALSKLWQSWGVEPAAVLGHSVGEYVAATVAGCLEPEAAMRLVSERGRLMQRAKSGGGMLAVFGEEEEVRELCVEEWGLSVAAENGGGEWVYSGPEAALGLLGERCAERGLKTRKVKTSHAFHSAALDEILDEFERACGGVESRAPRLALVSNVSGRVKGDAPDGKYWRRQARETVRFGAGLATLKELGCNAFIELGPQPVLTSLGQRALGSAGLDWLPSLRRGHSDCRQLFQSLGALFVRGAELDWSRIDAERQRRRVSLPAYPFQGTSLRRRTSRVIAARTPPAKERQHALLGERRRSAAGDCIFESELSAGSEPIREHVLRGQVIFPAAGYLAMWLLAARATGREQSALLNIVFREPLILTGTDAYVVQTLERRVAEEPTVLIASQPLTSDADTPWYAHMEATRAERAEARAPAGQLSAQSGDAPQPLSGDSFYADMRERGYELGPSFQWLASVTRGDCEALGVVRAPRARDVAESYVLHPGLIDACFQLFGVAWERFAKADSLYVPLGIERFCFYPGRGTPRTCRARLRSSSAAEAGEVFTGDVELCDEAGELVIAMEGLCVRRTLATVERAAQRYVPVWRPAAEPRLPAAAPGAWLICARATGFGRSLVQALEASGQRAWLLSASDEVEAREGLREATAAARSAAWRGVVHLAEPEDATDEEDGARQQLATLLTQFRCASELLPDARFWVVTRGGQALEVGDVGDAAGLLAQAPLWGFARSAALEYPNSWGGLIDLDPRSPVDAARLARVLLAGQPQSELALRGGQCLSLTWQRVQAEAPEVRALIRADGGYLITGGLGGVGIALARWLAERGARHIALVQRSEPSPAVREQLRALSALGAEISTFSVDVAQRDQVAALMLSLKSKLPPLRGIVHAAGALDDGVIAQQTMQRFERVFAAKALGARWLHAESEGLALDFFVMCSSIASVLGSVGQSNYAAANAFLDAFAFVRRARGLPALSVNFGPFAQLGMTARLSARDGERLSALGLRAMQKDSALAALAGALDPEQPSPEVAILHGEWPRARLSEAADESSLLLDRLQSARGAERRDIVRRFVQEQSALVLGHAEAGQLDPRVPLRNFGLDSLMALSLSKALARGVGRALPPALLFNYPSIEEVSDYLLNQLACDGPTSTSAPASAPAVVSGISLAEITRLSEQELGAAVDEEIARLARGT